MAVFRAAGIGLLVMTLPACYRGSAPTPTVDGLTPVPAARFVVEAFGRYSLVAFSEPRHGAGGTKELLASIITIDDVLIARVAAFDDEILDSFRKARLPIVLAELQRDPELTLMVKAFADAREPDGDRLSQARARTVVGWLTSRGVEPPRLRATGCGSSRALWFGRTEMERAANRRAELVRASPLAACAPPSSFDIH